MEGREMRAALSAGLILPEKTLGYASYDVSRYSILLFFPPTTSG